MAVSPEAEETEIVNEKPIQRSGAGRTPLKHHQTRHSPPPVKSKSAKLAKRAKSVGKISTSESLLQPLQRTFSKNRLTRRLVFDDAARLEAAKEKEQSWNCRSITEFTDSEDRVVETAESLRELENFIFDKILQMDSVTKGKTSTRADQIFHSGLKEFRINLISTYSVAVKDVRLCIRYKDLIVNFEKTIRVACYKIIHSQSPPFSAAALAQYKSDNMDGFPVNMAINAFRSFLNEFMQRQQVRQKQDEIKTHRTLSKKRKVKEDVIQRNGHQLVALKQHEDEDEQLQRVYSSIRKMPKANHDLLERLFFHLARIAKRSDVNQMNPENLAIIFAPVLFKSDRDLRAYEVSDYKKQIRCIQIIIDAQLQKLQMTLEDIGQIDSAAMTANTRLSVIRSSKVYVAAANSRTGSPNVPDTVPDADEEVRLSNEILSLKKEKDKRAMDLASLRLSRQPSQEGSHLSNEDISTSPDVWQPRKSSSIQSSRPSGHHQREMMPKREAWRAAKTDGNTLVWL